jgi:hypothetical protein
MLHNIRKGTFIQKTGTVYFLLIFLGIVLVYNYFHQRILLTDELYYEFYQDQLSANRIMEILSLRSKYEWVNYLMIPLFYFLKFFFVAVWMYSGLIIYNFKTSFGSTFKVIIISEFVWIMPMLINIIYFSLIKIDYTLTDIQYFQPLSLLNMFEAKEVEPWMVFPLKSLNLFAFIHLLVMTFIFSSTLDLDFNSSLSYTMVFYVIGFIIWVSFITFIIISLVT